MKRFFSLLAISISISFLAAGQSKNKVVTETIHVSGVCGQCKDRIEKTAYIPGVKRAEWDKGSKGLTVSYRSAKVTKEQIEEAIARSGHDAGETKASDSAYQNLPSCCAYKKVADH